MKNVLAVIPARIGSKGIKEKNLLKIGDFTLVERALFTAIGCKFINRIIVSSDSKKIINIVNKYGNYAPFKRPSYLATDQSGSLGVIQNALDWAEKKDNLKYNYIVLLEPPSPFRLPSHVEECFNIAIKNDATSVMSVIEVGDYHPIRMKKIDKNGVLRGFFKDEPDGLRRQDQEPVFIRNCAVYIFSRKNIKSNLLWGNNSFGYVMNRDFYSINIDNPIDALTANAFYEKLKKEKTNLNNIEFIPIKKDFTQ